MQNFRIQILLQATEKPGGFFVFPYLLDMQNK